MAHVINSFHVRLATPIECANVSQTRLDEDSERDFFSIANCFCRLIFGILLPAYSVASNFLGEKVHSFSKSLWKMTK